MARRSKLGQWTSSASAKAEVLSPAVSLSVQQVTVPLVRSSEYASAGVRAELRVKPSSAPLFRQRTSEIRPAGSLGMRRSAPVAALSTCSVPTPSSFVTHAIHRSSGDRSRSEEHTSELQSPMYLV